MPGILYLFKNWWKQFLLVMGFSLLAVGIITFLKPLQWLSVATAVPSSAMASDKSAIFNENIEALYSALGTPDDLDMILGTAKLDTVYLAVTDRFNLFDHYKTKDTGAQRRMHAAHKLKKNTCVVKSEYGELKIKVWDTDRNLAPQLANEILDQLQRMYTELKNAGNRSALSGLQDALKKMRSGVDSNHAGSADRIAQYEKLASEYQLMIDSKPPALLVVEKAMPSLDADRPRRIQALIATAVLSFLFSFLAALALERRKIYRRD